MVAGDKIFLADKLTLDKVDSNIGSRANGEQTVFERLAALETKMAAMQTFVTDQMAAMTETINGIDTIIGQSLNFDAVNSDRDKPLNVYILETVYALRVNDESIDWIFRQQGGVGFFLWSYFKLPNQIKAEIVPLGTISAVAASATAMQAVAASIIAMNAIGKSATARAAIKDSAQAYKVILDTDMAVCKYAYGEAGGDTSAFDTIAELSQDSKAMGVLAASTTAMGVLANSTTAMLAIYNSSIARAACLNSTIARNAFDAKCTSMDISGTSYGSGWTTVLSGRFIIVKMNYSYNSGTCGIGNYLDGTTNRTWAGATKYSGISQGNNGTYHYTDVYGFASALRTYNSQGDWPTLRVFYIKIS